MRPTRPLYLRIKTSKSENSHYIPYLRAEIGRGQIIMFYHFFVAYKTEIPMYSWSNFKSTPLIKRILFILMAGVWILACIMILLHNIKITFFSFMSEVILLLFLSVVDSHTTKKHSNIFFKQYADEKLNPLIEMSLTFILTRK